jgi:hypothetical protein
VKKWSNVMIEHPALPKEANPKSTVSTDNYRTFSPVTVSMTETIGVLFLGILAIVLLINLLRALARNRELEVALARRLPGEID